MKNINIKNIIAVTAVFIVGSSGFIMFKNQSTLNNETHLYNYVEGFEKNTLITLTALSVKNIKEKQIRTDGQEKTVLPFSENKTPAEFILNIQNQKQNFDIITTQNRDQIILKFENMPVDTKISILSENAAIHKDVPVDWAGHLTLHQTQINSTLCAMINNKEKICFEKNRRGTA